jgi:hypothetical protein
MPIDTGKVEGRRTLTFTTLDDILADLERLEKAKLRTLGNWSSGQVLMHLSVPIEWCLDGAKVRAPWYIRVFGWFVKNRFLRNPMPAGFALPEATAAYLVPGETSWEDGLRILRAAIQRLKTETQRHPSPFLGVLTREQWDQLHCRHAELHLSFLIPESA